MVEARAPGRVNLIGDHTDYTGGYVLPMAINRETVVELAPGGEALELISDSDPEPARMSLPVHDPANVRPAWARYVAGVAAVLGSVEGGTGRVRTTVPVGAGLSSSAALEVAVALALGFEGSPLELALACQQAEQLASGVPCGVMDQLASAAGVRGHALLIDCTSLEVTPVPLPDTIEVVAVHSGESRSLAGSAYADRRAECEQAERTVGPLRHATPEDLSAIDDAVVRRRARHVVTENARVLAFTECLRSGDLSTVGTLMAESHRSLREDFEVSTPALDVLVERLTQTPGVYGARLTGAGFGGCVVALARPGTAIEGWHLVAADGASVRRR